MAKKSAHHAFLNDPSWYKDAVIYQVHVKSYFDSNNDGIGDFVGLIEKLDHIAELGVNAIWLLPFYPSPMRDDGYDIAEYRAIYPAYGTMADARRFIKEAHKRGLRVITELVINHTSDQHPWFQKARSAKKDSKARNFYVWSDTNQKYEGTRIIFSDTESSNWTWDPVAGQYFWHRFYSNQPDLNFDNPEVLKEVLSIMRFWFDIGVDGLRLDAIPYLIEREGTLNENLPETHAVLKQIRAYLDAQYPDRMLLAEANLWPEDIQQYFGNGDECHMAFHFPLMPRMYMAIAQEDRFPIIDILRQMPDIPENCQWAIFLRNHDELTLEMVTDSERDYLWNHYAVDKRARLNLGIRRRLAPLVERDRRRIELLNSLLLSMPGTPTIYYGDEIGMGDNIFLGDRHGVRTPMQWSNDRNGGFSRADPASLTLPAIMDPLYGFQTINVEAQARDTHSLLNWTRRMLAVRKQQKAFGRGSLKILTPVNRRILAYIREYTNADGTTEIILCVANMSRAAQAAELDLSLYAGKAPVEMIGGTLFPPITKLNYLLTLPPYGFYWFLLADETQMPAWYVAPIETMPELPTLIIKQGLIDLLQLPARDTLEQESLPAYFPKRPWVCRPGEPANEVSILHANTFGDEANPYLLMEVELNCRATPEYYYLPLAFVPDSQAGTLSQQLAIARLRQKRTVGLLTDAFTLPDFSRKVIRKLRDRVVEHWEDGEVHYIPAQSLLDIDEHTDEEINLVATKQANCAVVVGEAMVLKPVRRLVDGLHPEIEISNYLIAHNFNHIPPILGEVRRVDKQDKAHTLMILQGYETNQGDAWQWAQSILDRAFRDLTSSGSSSMDSQSPPLDELCNFARILGKRLGEMHMILSQKSNNPRFGTKKFSRADAVAWGKNVIENFNHALQLLDECRTVAGVDAVDGLRANSKAIEKLISTLASRATGALCIRIHGNLHLARVLVVRDDAYFANFEEESTGHSTAGELHSSPFNDVADMLCSFDDAAAVAIRNITTTDVLAETDKCSALAIRYLKLSRTAFYDAYRNTAKSIITAEAKQQNEAMLALCSIDNRINTIFKAHYDVNWLSLPTQGLWELVSGLLDK
ncbi:MAG: maltose alpha-D-glucosyltransferase [Cellvibrio sp.]|uniref:maltose alpha-D-glucosyltransferase n=1 Tax=Cellvibrio sp. TaxID=1965322 RepID=UPI0031A33272